MDSDRQPAEVFFPYTVRPLAEMLSHCLIQNNPCLYVKIVKMVVGTRREIRVFSALQDNSGNWPRRAAFQLPNTV